MKRFYQSLIAITLFFVSGLLISCGGKEVSQADSASDDTQAECAFADTQMESAPKWYVGKWRGELKTKFNEKFVVTINDDGTCYVRMRWYWGGNRTADFPAEWERVDDDVIKIFDYDGHTEHWDVFNGITVRPVSRWCMYLRKDGAFDPDCANLSSPAGWLKQ